MNLVDVHCVKCGKHLLRTREENYLGWKDCVNPGGVRCKPCRLKTQDFKCTICGRTTRGSVQDHECPKNVRAGIDGAGNSDSLGPHAFAKLTISQAEDYCRIFFGDEE